MSDLVTQIEIHLLTTGTWVPTADLCSRYHINERALRAAGGRPGPLDHFAVSSTRHGTHGFIHHRHLPTNEWLPIKHRQLRHAISELRKVRTWAKSRHNILTGPQKSLQELHTHQTLLPL